MMLKMKNQEKEEMEKKGENTKSGDEQEAK